MAHALTVLEVEGDFAKLQLEGWVEPGEMRQINAQVLELVAAFKCTRLLLDARQFIGRQNLAEVSEEINRMPSWVHAIRTAIVDTGDHPEYDGYYERSARSKGFAICYFRSIEDALQWLRAD